MFELIKKTSVSEYNGDALLYRDTTTGMEVFHVKNDSRELCCAFIFGTPSEDSKGTAHILEHTVLCGSKRYPVKDPFSQLCLSSPNTFLNAMTFCDKTMYPFASALKKDFDNIFDVYADAVFAPLLRRESFEQEGIRTFSDRFDGVVFNEMTGALSTEDAVAESYCARKLFEGTPCVYESGGEPYFIADLTYEEYLARYRKWYSPSNCRLFLFGDLDAEEYMQKISERYLTDLSGWDNVKITVSSEPYLQPDLKPCRDVAKTSSEAAHSVLLTWLTCPSDNVDETFTASLLVDILLGSPSSPLYRAITESGLGEDLSQVSGINTEYPVITFTAGFVNAKKNSEDKIEKFLLDTFKGYVKNGLDKDAVACALRRQEFKVQEITDDGFPFGLGVCLKAARTWMRGKDPVEGILELAKLERLKKNMEKEGYLEAWIEKYLLNNKRRCLLSVVEDPELLHRTELAMKTKLDFIHSHSLEDRDKAKQRFDAFLASEDSPEDLARIPRITRKDLPETFSSYDTKTVRIQPYKFYTLTQTTRGIVYLHLAFSCKSLNRDEKLLFPLLMRLLQLCGTEDKDWVCFGNRMRYLTGSFSMSFSAGRGYSDSSVSNLIIRTKMFSEDLEEVLVLIRQLLTRPNFAEPGRILAALTDLITDFESNFIDSASSYASLESASSLSPSALENELTLGISSYLYIRKLREGCKKNTSKVEKDLLKLLDKLISKQGLSLHLSCEEACLEELSSKVEAFAASIPDKGPVVESSFYSDFERSKQTNEVYMVSSAPAFNAMGVPLDKLSVEQVSDLVLLGSVLSNGCLWNSVRGKYGAYAVECHVDSQEQMYLFSSYRDPLIENTYGEFRDCLTHSVTLEEKDFAVITVIGRELKPRAPWGRSAESFRRVMYNVSDELYSRRRQRILCATCEDLNAAAKLVLEKLEQYCTRVTVCGNEMKDSVLPDSVVKPLPL